MTRRRGFTLIEMLTVVVILGILATLAVPRVRDARDRANAVRLLEQVRTIQTALAGVKLDTAFSTNPIGVVPPALVSALGPNAFVGPEGIKMMLREMHAVSNTHWVIIIMANASPNQRRIVYLWHLMETDEHLISSGAMLGSVPLTRTPCTAPAVNSCRVRQ